MQRVVDTLQPRVVGRRVQRLDVHRLDYLKPHDLDWRLHLEARVIASIGRRAKRIVFRLDDGRGFYIHLGMSGRVNLERADSPLPPHAHVRILLDDDAAVTVVDPRRFGNVTWLGEGAGDAAIGPEPLTLRPRVLAGRLAGTSRAVKSALLDQRLIAGLGNIYVDESLHRAGIHPLHRCRDLNPEAVRRLNRAIKTTLRRAIGAGGSTLRDYVDANGDRGNFQKLHRVYGREGQPCPACGTAITRQVIGGRSTHFCGACQPAASAG